MRVLLTGGTGFIGRAMQVFLRAQGHDVRVLSRSGGEFTWDPTAGTISPNTLQGVDGIIHLAGAGIADARWTAKRKQELIDSRVKSTELLAKALREQEHQVKVIVSASAIGYYGADSGSVLCTETSPSGSDFLAVCTRSWEAAVDLLPGRVVKLRIGLVLGTDGGIFPTLMRPIRFGLGAILGTGNQGQSWIHRDDLVRMFALALVDERLSGVYNAVAPTPISHAEMTIAMAKAVHRPLFLPKVPAWGLRLVLGEMACLVLGGNFVSSKKIQEFIPFTFTYNRFEEALTALIHE